MSALAQKSTVGYKINRYFGNIAHFVKAHDTHRLIVNCTYQQRTAFVSRDASKPPFVVFPIDQCHISGHGSNVWMVAPAPRANMT